MPVPVATLKRSAAAAVPPHAWPAPENENPVTPATSGSHGWS